MSNTYSVCPIILVIYNLPQWVGMKETSFILLMIIPGGKNLRNEYKYLSLTITSKIMWTMEEVLSYDVVTKENYNIRASPMWIINNFPTYSILFRWNTKGQYASPCCVENTKSLWLSKSKKSLMRSNDELVTLNSYISSR